MAKKKRVNPSRIPVSRDALDVERIIEEESEGNMYLAWLLVMPVLLQIEGLSTEETIALWDSANKYISDDRFTGANLTKELTRIEDVLHIQTPNREMYRLVVRSEASLKAFRRKIRENALHTGLCVVAIGLEGTKRFDDEELRRIFLNAELNLAEIQQGCTSYDDLRAIIRDAGIDVLEGDSFVELFSAETNAEKEA